MAVDVAEAEVRSDEESRVYHGRVIIEWPAPHERRPVLPGWGCSIFDAETGKQIVTVSRIKVPGVQVTADAESVFVAELTMFADEDGKPVLFPDEHPSLRDRLGPTRVFVDDDGNVRTGTFLFLVAEMRVRGA